MRSRRKNKGQAMLEYILLIVLVATTVAVAIRNLNINIYRLWTGLTRQVASPCVSCTIPDAPDFD